MPVPSRSRYDAVVVGGGHNGLVAAAYLARAGRSVCVLERAGSLGGAAVSTRPFPGVDARLSSYSYLVSLLPRKIVEDLGLRFDQARRISSYTPTSRAGRDGGLLVDAAEPTRTADSLRNLTGDDREIEAWRLWDERCAALARAVLPTLTEPLRARDAIKAAVGDGARAGKLPAAAHRRMSMGPNWSCVLRSAAVTASYSRTSSPTVSTYPGGTDRGRGPSSRSCLRPARTTLAPCSANRSAIRWPMPLPPPVMKAVLPCNR